MKRKHETENEEKAELDMTESVAPVLGAGRRQMQGQGDDKHTIDSDDEEDERQRDKQFETMKDDDIEGQEDNTLNFDGDIQITPFNLKEEQQEGTFSKDGNFVWNEKKDDVKDAWLDDVDWIKVKQRTEDEVKRREEEDEKEEEEQGRYSEITSYKDMLALLQPGESVGRALRRLGGNKKSLSASERWKKKKAGEVVEDPEIQKNKEIMLKLSGLADGILSRSGNMEVYEETYESITYRLEKEEKKTDVLDDDCALDMFAEELDTKTEKETPENGANSNKNGGQENAGSEEKVTVAVNVEEPVMWEFKWKNEEGEDVHGPYSSEKMLEWQESEFFAAGVWCRKVGSAGDFLTSKRIEFDLYV